MRKIYYILVFVAIYLVKLVQANLFIAWDILTPGMHTNPAFMEIPLTLKTNLGLLLYSNLLSMTPGSLSMEISEDRSKLKVHILYYSSNEEMMKDFIDIQEKIKRITG